MSRSLRELRFVFGTGVGGESAGVREFLASNYNNLKQANPKFPLLVREGAMDTKPMIIARYAKGVEKHVAVGNMSASEVEATVAKLAEA